MVADPCYKAMEEQIIKTKSIRETVFQVLGILIKKYNHGMSCVIKLVQVISFIFLSIHLFIIKLKSVDTLELFILLCPKCYS